MPVRKVLFANLVLIIVGLGSLKITDSQAAAETMVSIPMQERHTATYTVPIRVNGGDEQAFLVDTGASFTTISSRMMKKLLKTGQAVFLRDMKAIMADGTNKHLKLYRVKHLVLGNVCHIHNAEVIVAGENSRYILGLNILRQLAPFTISIDPPELALSHCEVNKH